MEIVAELKDVLKQIFYMLLLTAITFVFLFFGFIAFFSMAKYVISNPDSWMIYAPITVGISLAFSMMTKVKQQILNKEDVEIPRKEIFALMVFTKNISGLVPAILFNILSGIQVSIISAFLYIILTNISSSSYFIILLILGSLIDAGVTFYYSKTHIRTYYLVSITAVLILFLALFNQNSGINLEVIGIMLWAINSSISFIMQKESIQKNKASL